jgi:hypothetical protein
MGMGDIQTFGDLRSRFMRYFIEARQYFVNKGLSWLYGVPMQVMPKGNVALAGAVVLWFAQEGGGRQFIMIRSTKDGKAVDGRARFVSVLGVGRHANVPEALQAALKAQLGEVFAKSAGMTTITADRVAAAPLFSYVDESTGVAMPVQSLVWVVHVAAPLADIVTTPDGLQAVMVPEFALRKAEKLGDKISPTHKALWQAVQRQLPKMKGAEVIPLEGLEDVIRPVGSGGRLIH